MFRSKEFRARGWQSLKGKYWKAFAATALSSVITSFSAKMFQDCIAVMEGASEFSSLPEAIEAGPEVILTVLIIALGGAVIAWLLGLLLMTFVDGPLQVGVCKFFVANTDGTPAVKDIFTGFKVNYWSNVKIMFLRFFKITLWTLLLVIPGIVKALEYEMIPYILADNPGLTSKEAFAASKKMMTGNKWNLFKLAFSFIGWETLCIFTLGIGTFFLHPYMEATFAAFYDSVKEKAEA